MIKAVIVKPTVSVPYEITLLSNVKAPEREKHRVSVPYEITLLSNRLMLARAHGGFQYLMKLHYSQTIGCNSKHLATFQYLMKLHYSQTFTY